MTSITKTFLGSFVALTLGALAVGTLLFAFAIHADAHGNAPYPAPGAKLEVSIDSSGHALVRGAEVTAVNGSTITARTAWGASALTWTLHTDGDTDFVRLNGSDISKADIATGDSISFSGKIDTTAGVFTLTADTVKDWSLDDQSVAFFGTVNSVDTAAGTFSLKTFANGTITVKTNGDTDYSSGANLASIHENDMLMASGSYDPDTHTLTALKVTEDPKLDTKTHVSFDWGGWMKNFSASGWFGFGHK